MKASIKPYIKNDPRQILLPRLKSIIFLQEYQNYNIGNLLQLLFMDKGQIKPRKDKKKNTETGILMGQNTNIFSQLSATYLQHKTSNTEEQNNFVKSTQIIEYHDPKINRLIALLRKKADVTKSRAAQQLREEFEQMTEQNLEQFIPTFAQIFLEIVIHEQSKQVTDEFISMINTLLTKNKQIAIRQIGTIYAPLLVINRPQSTSSLKVYSLLFNGTQEQLHEKSLTLLIKKKEVYKKFIIFSKSILECDQIHKVSQQNYQRNCSSLCKVIKDLIVGFEITYENLKKSDEKKAEQFNGAFNRFLMEIDELLIGKCVDEYFKVGGKAKASILEIYQTMIKTAMKHPEWKLEWEKYGKLLCQNYLDKDFIVQQSLWKYCNRAFIQCCLQIEKIQEKEPYSIFIKYLPKPDDKLLQVLKVGGLGLYKQLPNYCTVFPITSFSSTEKQTHKSVIIKLTFIKKLMNTILNDLQDQNEARMECYYELTKYFIKSFSKIEFPQDLDPKKLHQLKLMLTKSEKQLIQNLQNKFYTNPPASRNSFTYNLPTFFCKLLQQLHPNFDFLFNDKFTFALYKEIKMEDEYSHILADKIFEKSKNNKHLLLSYLESFASKPINIDLSEGVEDPEVSAKIFLLSKQADEEVNWFKEEWDERIKIMVYDPRITQLDLNSYEQSVQNSHYQSINFSVARRSLPKIYEKDKHQKIRLKYFLNTLSNPSNETAQTIPLLLPFIRDFIADQGKENLLNMLLEIFQPSTDKLRNKKWVICVSEIMRVRVITDIGIDCIVSLFNEKAEMVLQNSANNFISSICSFALSMYNYKLEESTEEILKKLNLLTYINNPSIEQSLYSSVKLSIRECYQIFKASSKKSNIEQKQRRNRLERCLQFIKKVIWYGVRKNKKSSNEKFIEIGEQFLREKDGWKEATHKSDLWEIMQIIISSLTDQKYQQIFIEKVLANLINDNKYGKFIAYLSSCQYLLSLQRHPETKRVFLQFQSQIFKKIRQLPNNKDKLLIFKAIIQESLEDESLTVILGAKNLLKEVMKDYEKMQENILSGFLEECLGKPLQRVQKYKSVNKSELQKNILLIINLCGELPLLDISSVLKSYELVEMISQSEGNKEYLEYMVVLVILWQAGIGRERITKEKINEIINKSLSLYKSILEAQATTETLTNFNRFCILTIFNSLSILQGPKIFDSFQKQIYLDVISPTIITQTKLYGAVQLNKFKFISKVFESWNIDFKQQIVRDIPNQMLVSMNTYKNVLDQIQNDESEQSMQIKSYENIIGVFIESAEVLVKFAENLSPNAYPQEEVILKLMECPFPGLKRTSFIVLKRMYEMNLVAKVPPHEFLGYLRLDPKICKQELDANIAFQISKYLNFWQSIIYRKSTTDRSTEEDNQITLEDYIQQPIQGQSSLQLYYENFLKTVFEILDSQLNYLNNEQQFTNIMTPEELISEDAMIVIQDDFNLQNKIYRLVVKSLFVFVLNFPIFLRNFIDKNKKFKNICDRVLRNIISDSIFQEQITKIQMQEHEWKLLDNFDIFVTPKKKEIDAKYTHESIEIGLRLIMKDNFPMTPIIIEFSDGLKMQNGSRLALMLQSQLQNRNNTILNGILLWKENVDKRFEGVEECAICFDIVDGRGKMPNKGCKTCKKKFHSNCVMKWFNKSNKSQCPLCKSQFL